MTHSINGFAPKSFARFAGLLYLIIAIAGGFSIGYMPSVVVIPGDAAATAESLLAHPGLFRLGIGADIIVFILEVVLTVMLFRLFKPVNALLSRIAAFSRMGMAVVMAVNLLNLLMPSLLLGDAAYLEVFGLDQLQAMSLLFFEAHQFLIWIWGLFFGLHLFILGYLIFKSGYFPKLLGILSMVGSLGYTLESVYKMTLPEVPAVSIGINILLGIVVIGELGFTFWLLIKGMKVEAWEEKVRAVQS